MFLHSSPSFVICLTRSYAADAVALCIVLDCVGISFLSHWCQFFLQGHESPAVTRKWAVSLPFINTDQSKHLDCLTAVCLCVGDYSLNRFIPYLLRSLRSWSKKHGHWARGGSQCCCRVSLSFRWLWWTWDKPHSGVGMLRSVIGIWCFHLKEFSSLRCLFWMIQLFFFFEGRWIMKATDIPALNFLCLLRFN